MSTKSHICIDTNNPNATPFHDLIVVGWHYDHGDDLNRIYTKSKIAKELLCQKCFLTFDLKQIEICQKNIE